MLEKVSVPEEVKRQNRLVVTTKTVWWNRSVAVFVHDFQVLTLVHQTLTQLRTVECQATPAKDLTLESMVIVKLFGNWYRAQVERLYGKYASLTLVDVGRFLEKVHVRLLLDINNLCPTIAFSPKAELFFVDRFHPLQFRIPDPEVLNRPAVQQCIYTASWVEEQLDRESEQFPVIKALFNESRESFADVLEPLLGGATLPQQTTGSSLSDVELHPSEEVSVFQIDGSLLGVQLKRFPAEELARLECELTVRGERNLLPSADALQENELVAVEWNEKRVRGRLSKFGVTTAEVYLVDYGIFVHRSNVNLSKLPQDIADRLPAFGLRVRVRNSVSEISEIWSPQLVLSSIEVDNATGVATADVFRIEPFVEAENQISEKESNVEESMQPETIVDGTATYEDAVVPSLDTLPGEPSTDDLTLDSFNSSRQTEPENTTNDFDVSCPAESTMSQSMQSYLSPTEREDPATLEENGILELSNEFEPLSDMCDIPPENEATAPLTPNGSCDTTSEGKLLPQKELVTDEVGSHPEPKMNGGTCEPEQVSKEPVAEIANQVPNWRRENAGNPRRDRSTEKSWREPRRDAIQIQSAPDQFTSTPKRSHQFPTVTESDPPHRHQASRNDRRSTPYRAQGADSRPRDDFDSDSSRQVISHSRHRAPGSGRFPRDRSVEKSRSPWIRETSQAHKNETPDSHESHKLEADISESSVKAQENGEPESGAAPAEDPEQENVASPPSFSVECVLKEKDGVFLGAHKIRKQSIERLLSALSVDSLSEIPLRRLKIDQLVLLEHMNELVRGRVVEITRHKIELRLVDKHGACSTTRVFACPPTLADPGTTLQEIQLQPPRQDLHYGDTVHVIKGERHDGERLVVSEHEIRGKGNQNN